MSTWERLRIATEFEVLRYRSKGADSHDRANLLSYFVYLSKTQLEPLTPLTEQAFQKRTQSSLSIPDSAALGLLLTDVHSALLEAPQNRKRLSCQRRWMELVRHNQRTSSPSGRKLEIHVGLINFLEQIDDVGTSKHSETVDDLEDTEFRRLQQKVKRITVVHDFEIWVVDVAIRQSLPVPLAAISGLSDLVRRFYSPLISASRTGRRARERIREHAENNPESKPLKDIVGQAASNNYRRGEGFDSFLQAEKQVSGLSVPGMKIFSDIADTDPLLTVDAVKKAWQREEKALIARVGELLDRFPKSNDLEILIDRLVHITGAERHTIKRILAHLGHI